MTKEAMKRAFIAGVYASKKIGDDCEPEFEQWFAAEQAKMYEPETASDMGLPSTPNYDGFKPGFSTPPDIWPKKEQ